uniref:(northern house mosquito) hypothetical protein n=1 Tax=Culex pipiens TaxID=7175 RepID=A0A8D8CBP2_CULPI
MNNTPHNPKKIILPNIAMITLKKMSAVFLNQVARIDLNNKQLLEYDKQTNKLAFSNSLTVCLHFCFCIKVSLHTFCYVCELVAHKIAILANSQTPNIARLFVCLS